MFTFRFWRIASGFACLVLGTQIYAAGRVIDSQTYFLGTAGFPEWEENIGRKPHGRELHLDFAATANSDPRTLLIQQEGVKQGWSVYLNGKRLGNLSRSQTKLVHILEVPPKAFRAGKNRISVRAPKQVDDIDVGPITVLDGPPKTAVAEGWLEVDLVDGDGVSGPGRITIADENGAQAALVVPGASAKPITAAARPGVVYTGNGKVRIGLREGNYTIYGSRGFEFGIDRKTIQIAAGKTLKRKLRVVREVDTTGWVSVDTHIHTLTFSGHGDSSVDERLLTVVGEGIDVAISTDHNHHTDFEAPARKLGVHHAMTAVVGNEVTTKIGHLNAFPVSLESPVPNYKQTNWSALLKDIRRTPGVRVVALNHPRNVHSGFSPMSTNNFDRVSGKSRMGIGFDGMEVVTSAAMQSDIMALFRDWFALLNRGERITGLGASDTHDVSRFILGQACTYLQADDRDPGNINVEEVCESLLQGRASVSFGLLAKIDVDGKSAGDTVQQRGKALTAIVEVHGPSWVRADHVELFANGISVGKRSFKSGAAVVKGTFRFNVGLLPNDAHLVAIATGPGLREPFWDTPRPYQVTSKRFVPRLLAATNPVWVDVDGNGRFDSARAMARRILLQSVDPESALMRCAKLDAAVAVQLAELLGIKTSRARLAELSQSVDSDSVRDGMAAYLSGRAQDLYIRQ
jgi:hypothetical protein